jgi:ubiquinone/menaquinone biosynthesis C-methylase UbiE
MNTESASIDQRATAQTRARYDRNAPFYDQMTRGSEKRLDQFRAAMWKAVRGPRVLEVGVGTGINMPYYPVWMQITAIDLSTRMLERARHRALQLRVDVDLREADVQALPFEDASFDSVVATCVFCSVPDPVLGLRGLRRVLVPGGQLLLLEHVLSERPVIRQLMHVINPVVVRMMGANINRETVENVRKAGFDNVQVQDLFLEIFKSISANSAASGPGGHLTDTSLVAAGDGCGSAGSDCV